MGQMSRCEKICITNQPLGPQTATIKVKNTVSSQIDSHIITGDVTVTAVAFLRMLKGGKSVLSFPYLLLPHAEVRQINCPEGNCCCQSQDMAHLRAVVRISSRQFDPFISKVGMYREAGELAFFLHCYWVPLLECELAWSNSSSTP